MKKLVEIFNEIGNFSGVDIGANDKNSTHTYLETYDKLMEPFQKGCNFMEIGLATGDSIKLFDEYFDNSDITGVDISVIFKRAEYKNYVSLIQGDATRTGFLKFLGDKKFDIVLDDASHLTQDQIITFNLLKSRMNPGGIYIMEDILALDIEREKYMALHDNCTIIDMRDNGRFDNVIIYYRF